LKKREDLLRQALGVLIADDEEAILLAALRVMKRRQYHRERADRLERKLESAQQTIARLRREVWLLQEDLRKLEEGPA
tara:strand:- start:346 stop:579 length:234 start_codon:yes stop_codon:yes gene_type:complete